jgi:hypothetical protein
LKRIYESAIQVGGDLSDPVWNWFVSRGPHGPSFSWSHTKQEPPGFSGLNLLKQTVEEKTTIDPEFPQKAYSVATAALASENPELVRRAIQVISVVGTKSDREKIKPFLTHSVLSVVKDTKACLFELKTKY